MSFSPAGTTISTILRHDRKQTSYKIALLRSINDIVLNFPDLGDEDSDIAVPLLQLAEYWMAYYWAFVDSTHPINQGRGKHPVGAGPNDMAFRPALTTLRRLFEEQHGEAGPHDGFFLMNQMRIPRKRNSLSGELVEAYRTARRKTSGSLNMPIKHAGPGKWNVFREPSQYKELPETVALPGTQMNNRCVVIPNALWQSFRQLSLWVEALCIHEWCLFTEDVTEGDWDRGDIFRLLTSRPDNRVSLSWERNQINILLMEGKAFTCPWTGRTIRQSDNYHLDHLLPLSIYPINEMWNLVPSDPRVNVHEKRDRIPSAAALDKARPLLVQTYDRYREFDPLKTALHDDVELRFASLDPGSDSFTVDVAEAATSLIDRIATYRNIERFEP